VATILLVHHGRPHFETVLALYDTLKGCHKLYLWANFLHMFERSSLLQHLELSLYTASEAYDLVIVISGDQVPSEHEVPSSLWRLMQSVPVARVVHRFQGTRQSGEISLFPKAELSFIPVSTGLTYLRRNQGKTKRQQLLVQGNIENRRNYSLVRRLAESNLAVDICVCGIKVAEELSNGTNIFQYCNLSEEAFHRACAASDFIMPMLDPMRYPGYFTRTFTSSIQIGISYSLPFIAHKALFELYPISGLSYETDDEFINCVSQAADIEPAFYRHMQSEMVFHKIEITRRNREHLSAILAEIVPQSG
jgi:hypothetical protein